MLCLELLCDQSAIQGILDNREIQTSHFCHSSEESAVVFFFFKYHVVLFPNLVTDYLATWPNLFRKENA